MPHRAATLTSILVLLAQLEDSNKKYCRDLDEIRREKDELNSRIKALGDELGRAQSTTTDSDQAREVLEKRLAEEKLKKIQVRRGRRGEGGGLGAKESGGEGGGEEERVRGRRTGREGGRKERRDEERVRGRRPGREGLGENQSRRD